MINSGLYKINMADDDDELFVKCQGRYKISKCLNELQNKHFLIFIISYLFLLKKHEVLSKFLFLGMCCNFGTTAPEMYHPKFIRSN